MATGIYFQPTSDLWSCTACSFLNPLAAFPICKICGTNNDPDIPVSTKTNWSCFSCTDIDRSTAKQCEVCGRQTVSSSNKNEDGNRWYCSYCTYNNSKYADTCVICERGTRIHAGGREKLDIQGSKIEEIKSIPSQQRIPQNNLLYDTEISSSNSLFTSTNDAIIDKLLIATNDHIKIAIADPQAFNNDFVELRQQAINNLFYRSTIESWHPNSLQQLIEAIEILSKNKSRIDQSWFIFYWIAYNIEYDTVSYFSKNYGDQSAEEVFRTKKGVCGGYSNLYKHLCDKLGIPCKMISGYSKGYGFDNNENALFETNHGWNAVEIEQHWYLMDSTWGTGYLNEDKVFKRHLDLHYFLSRPDEMIYNHLPKNEIWQLLQRPISMTQYMQMPQIYPAFFEFYIELISPRQQAHVALIPGLPYALVLIQAPSNVELSADLKLFNKKVDGGCRVIFDSRRHLYACYFAPNRIGKHDITIFGIFNDSLTKLPKAMLQIPFDVTEMVQNPVSFPRTTKEFDDLNLEVLSPNNTHLIKVGNGTKAAQIIIQAPKDVELIGHLQDKSEKNIPNTESIYYDKQKGFWRCYFAPNQDGVFNAHIFAGKKSNAHKYSFVVTFQIEAKEISKLPLSYPHMWQLFHDLNLEVESPKHCSTIMWPETASCVEILMRASDHVQLTCGIHDNGIYVENGALAQYNSERNLWQLLFAPQRAGEHKLNVSAKQITSVKFDAVIQFNMYVTELQRSMKFPIIYTHSKTSKIRIYEPIDGILEEGSTVLFHSMIPNATDVNIAVDSKWLTAEGYQDPILKRKITVGSKDVVIYAKYGQGETYKSVIAYCVKKC